MKLTDNSDTETYEVLDAHQLAERWRVPVTWVREHTRRRSADPIPRVKLNKYVRFEWGSPRLRAWWNKHREK